MAKRRRKVTPAEDEQHVEAVAMNEANADATRNQNLIFGVLVALVVLFGAYLAYKHLVVEPKNEKAVALMYEAEQLFAQDSFARALGLPTGGFLDIAENYSGTPSGNLANYYAGVSYLNIGKYEAAVSYLKDFDAEGDVMEIMKYGTLGDAYSELGKFGDALDSYRSAARAEDNDVLTPYYLKKAGLLAEKEGKSGDAQEYFQTIYDNYPNSIEARDIQKYLGRVQG